MVTRQQRERAIFALDLAASNVATIRDYIAYDEEVSFSDAVLNLGGSERVARLMDAAWGVTTWLTDSSQKQLAGAACLLRDGWSPGEPTYSLHGRMVWP